jgi:hypothetical protein
MKEFEAYSVGICCASVCSSLSADETEQRLNDEYPTGLNHGWHLSEDKMFKTGQPMPCPCENNPANKHYLFNC